MVDGGWESAPIQAAKQAVTPPIVFQAIMPYRLTDIVWARESLHVTRACPSNGSAVAQQETVCPQCGALS